MNSFSAGQPTNQDFLRALEANGIFQAYIKVELSQATPYTSASIVIDETYLPRRHPHPHCSESHNKFEEL